MCGRYTTNVTPENGDIVHVGCEPQTLLSVSIEVLFNVGLGYIQLKCDKQDKKD